MRQAATVLCAVLVLLIVPARAQSQADPGATQANTKGQPKQPEKDPLGGLDELLGLKKETETAPDELPLDPAQTQLERQLDGEQITEAFVEAARLMSDTADRIEAAGDTGIVTQRLQEDVLKKLDMLIEAARNQQQQQRSNSSASRSSAQGQSQQQRSQSERAADGQNQGQAEPPSRQDGPLRPPSAALNATWGALPERVREALRQGQSSGFSSIYRALTEAYYRRLAEEAGR